VRELEERKGYAEDLPDFFPLLAHLLMVGELWGAERLLRRHSRAPVDSTLGKFIALLQERLTMPPFLKPTQATMDATTQPGARFDRWRREIRALLQRADFCLRDGAETLERILTGDQEVLVRLIRDGAEGHGEFLRSGTAGQPEGGGGFDSRGNEVPVVPGFLPYHPMRWALFLGAQILYGDLLGAQKHDLRSRLEHEPILSLVRSDPDANDQLDGEQAYQMLLHIVCNQEGANVMLAIKLLYQLPGPAPKVAVALLADLCAHAGDALLLDPLQPQMDCSLRERLLLELAEVLEAGLPDGWRRAARVLAHCDVHGHHALGELLLRVPVGLPTTPDRVVREVLAFCDRRTDLGESLVLERQAICGARAGMLLRKGRRGAAAHYLLRAGETARLQRLCREAFTDAATAVRHLVMSLDGGPSSPQAVGAAAAVEEHRQQLVAISKALWVASPPARPSTVSDYEQPGLSDDEYQLAVSVLFLDKYHSFLEAFTMGVCLPRIENAPNGSESAGPWLRKAAAALDAVLVVAPFGARPHLLRLVLPLMQASDGSASSGSGSSTAELFPHSMLERLTVALEELALSHRANGDFMCGEERLDDATVDRIRGAIATRLAASFVVLNAESGGTMATGEAPAMNAPPLVGVGKLFGQTYDDLVA
jgi:hypothetical protein